MTEKDIVSCHIAGQLAHVLSKHPELKELLGNSPFVYARGVTKDGDAGVGVMKIPYKEYIDNGRFYASFNYKAYPIEQVRAVLKTIDSKYTKALLDEMKD